MTSKAINSKKRINYLAVYIKNHKEKLDKKLFDYENYICKPPKPPCQMKPKLPAMDPTGTKAVETVPKPLFEPELKEGDVKEGFEHLKFFMNYLKSQYQESLI